MKINYEKYPALRFKFQFDPLFMERQSKFFKENFRSPKAVDFRIHSENYHKAILDFEESGSLKRILSENPNIWEEIPDTVGGILNYTTLKGNNVSLLYRKVGDELRACDIVGEIEGAFCGYARINLNDWQEICANGDPGYIKHSLIGSDFKDDDTFLKGFMGYIFISLVFEKYAKLEDKVYKAHMKKPKTPLTPAEENNTGVNVTFRNITWYTNIYRTDGFKVRGHFRLQPMKKNGKWTKELIYINEFKKHGYTRKAGMIKEERV